MNTICSAQPWAQPAQVFCILYLVDCLCPILSQIPILLSSYFLALISSTHKLVLLIVWSHQLMLTKTMNKIVPSFLFLKAIRMVKISELSNQGMIYFRSSYDCMDHLFNLDDFTIDSTLSLNSNLNWVFIWYNMHELIMSESSVYWLITAGYTPLWDLPLILPLVGTSLIEFNSIRLN